MIKFANDSTANDARCMWKTCFGDSDEFMDLFFSAKYKNENTLLYLENEKPVASLQMLPYKIRFYGEIIPFYYLAGLCTLPEFRNKGYMGQLIKKAYGVMRDRLIPLSILIPAEEWLLDYYAKYGFETTFEKGDKNINLKKILDENGNNIVKAYDQFDLKYQNNDFCVLKDKQDFALLLDENKREEYPVKSNLAAMSAIVDAKRLLELYAKKNRQNSLTITLHDTLFEKTSYYTIEGGNVIQTNTKRSNSDIEVTSQMLVRLLFGFRTDELHNQYSSLFERHDPVINLMLE